MRRTRTLLLTGLLAVVAAGSLTPAQAGSPKAFTGSAVFHDATPDPTGGSTAHCNGALPLEKPIPLKIANPGVVTLSLTGFQGDWALAVTDQAGKYLGGADTNPPVTENAVITLKKAGTILMLPCNLGGTFDATLSWAYRYKKP